MWLCCCCLMCRFAAASLPPSTWSRGRKIAAFCWDGQHLLPFVGWHPALHQCDSDFWAQPNFPLHRLELASCCWNQVGIFFQFTWLAYVGYFFSPTLDCCIWVRCFFFSCSLMLTSGTLCTGEGTGIGILGCTLDKQNSADEQVLMSRIWFGETGWWFPGLDWKVNLKLWNWCLRQFETTSTLMWGGSAV